MPIWLIIGIALAILAVGCALGCAATVYFARGAALQLARLDADEQQPRDDEPAWDDAEDRADALAVRDLIQAAYHALQDEPEALRLAAWKPLSEAVDAANARFAAWIDWAERATASKPALESAGADA